MEPDEERVIRLITDKRNRAILTALNDAARTLSVAELAERLIARDAAVIQSPTYEDELERVSISLHHHHLPKLAESGLIEYDREEKMVTYTDYTTVNAEWLKIEMIDELLSRFRPETESDADTLGVLEGRDEISTYSRHLVERAEDELFLIHLSEELLNEDCIPYAEAAIDRGVEYYVGSQNPEVREFFRRHLPAATIWEPQLDWMNAPSRYPRLRQLMLVDRELVIVDLMDEPDASSAITESAIVGEGVDNPLVVLVRELLGPRLDHLDYQSENFKNDLPF